MSTSGYLVNVAFLAFVLWANVGTRAVTRLRLMLPLVIVAAVAAGYLRDVPTRGGDDALDVVLGGAGVLLGLLAGVLVRVRRERGTVVMTAGAAYAAVWVAAIGGRMAFAYGADHWFGHAIARFSRDHLITGADAWTAAFVMMAVAMVVTRVAVTATRLAWLTARPTATLTPSTPSTPTA